MSTCPSIYELTEPAQLPPQLAAHLSGCPRCRALRAAWEADPTPDEGPDVDALPEYRWPHHVYSDVDAEPVRGALHSIWGSESGELLTVVVVDVDEREALVVPVSTDVHSAGDWDVLLDNEVLPYAAIAEVWNHLHVLREQFLEQLARLSSPVAEAIDAAVDAFSSGDELPSGLRQGPALLTDADPRHGFRDSEAALARGFTEPWRLLYAASTLGGVIRGRREDCDLELSGLGEEVDLEPDSLRRLEDDREDLHARVPVPAMARLIHRLSLPPSRRLAELVSAAAYENVQETTAATGVVRARRRRGMRSAAGGPPEAGTRREIADRYVAHLMERLEKSR
jgi:hypothetical protein